MMKRGFLWVLLIIFTIPFIFADGGHDAGGIDWVSPTTYILGVTYWTILITIIIFIFKKSAMDYKALLFWLIAAPIILSSLYLAGHTVYHNVTSETGGPVHWHADYQVWYCGDRIDLVNPRGLSNKIGTPLFHEHNDDRIHVEGTVSRVEDVTVAAFFKTIGGKITATEFAYPSEDSGYVQAQTGDSCSGEISELKVYVNGQRIDNVETYMYYPHPGVPPGDCVIIEFGPNLPETTERICDFWAANEWNYDNYKELRKQPNMGPVWTSENWEYVDGQGMVRVGGEE